jgi:hypothetical protein
MKTIEPNEMGHGQFIITPDPGAKRYALKVYTSDDDK